ncbi:MAG: hypothetical protein QOJ19_734 [Acidimicrobiia bacterium]|nr:hypothetical protein [Acidimicrobiia bacterium]
MAAPVASPAQRYLEQLSDSDLALLASASGVGARSEESPGYLRGHPELIEPALRSPGAFEQLFPTEPNVGLTTAASPFLLFAVAVHRGVADLSTATFVAEPFAGWRRIPIFDSASLQAHFDDPARRLFAVEHLASYTRVASGPVWVRSERGTTRRVRYSEVDPTRLAALVLMVDDDDKPGIYRRLGDLALLLTGVFPDWAAKTPAHPVTVERLVRSVQVPAAGASFSVEDVAPLTGASGLGGMLRVLGPHWYRLAAETTPLPPVRRVLQDAADGFEKARRFLTLLTDRYLFPIRGRWFGVPG